MVGKRKVVWLHENLNKIMQIWRDVPTPILSVVAPHFKYSKILFWCFMSQHQFAVSWHRLSKWEFLALSIMLRHQRLVSQHFPIFSNVTVFEIGCRDSLFHPLCVCFSLYNKITKLTKLNYAKFYILGLDTPCHFMCDSLIHWGPNSSYDSSSPLHSPLPSLLYILDFVLQAFSILPQK